MSNNNVELSLRNLRLTTPTGWTSLIIIAIIILIEV